MFTIKTLLAFFVLFAALVNAAPVSHRRIRRGCSHGSAASTTTEANQNNVEDSKTGNASATKSASSHKSTSTATSSNSNSSSSTTGGSTHLIGTELLAALMPVTQSIASNAGWTTLAGIQGALPLSDATFKPTKLLSALKHQYVAAPDGKPSMQATYPKGSYTYGHEPQGGFSFYSSGPSDVDLTTAKEATLGYSVFFAENFEFNKGGKLPGLCKSSPVAPFLV